MTVPAFFVVLQGHVLRAIPTWGGSARRAWCRKQRRYLGGRGDSVVWVQDDELPWAVWGARHGFFDVELMEGLAYLRARGVSPV